MSSENEKTHELSTPPKNINRKQHHIIRKSIDKGKLIVVYGPMFSGKTTKLIKMSHNYMIKGFSVIIIRHELDTRTKEIVTHNGSKILSGVKIDQLFKGNLNRPDLYDEYEVIMIDECQFFGVDNLLTFTSELVKLNKIVVCFGLPTDKDRKVFESMASVMCNADKLIQLKAVCKLCGKKKGIYSKLKTEHKNEQSDSSEMFVKIGADDMYQAVCRSCYSE